MKKIRIPKYDAMELYTCKGLWNKCIDSLRAEGLELITAKQLADARILAGRNSPNCRILTDGAHIAENFNFLPDGRILIASAKYNPLLKFPDEATFYAHFARVKCAFDPGSEYVKELLSLGKRNPDDARKSGVLILEKGKLPSNISVDEFGQEPITAFLGWGKEYGQFLKDADINSIQTYSTTPGWSILDDIKAKSHVTWVTSLEVESGLSIANRVESDRIVVFGMRKYKK